MDSTRTTTSLLDGLHDERNDAVWAQFDARYRPILLAFSRSLGLADADAADVAQETLTQFVREYRLGRYDRSRARLRSWLVSIARTRVAMVHRRRAVRHENRGESAIDVLPDDQTLTQIWEQQRRGEILRQALEQLKAGSRAADQTLEAFELVVFKQQPAGAVAELLGMTTHDVYLAKSRLTARLREIVERLESAFDEVE